MLTCFIVGRQNHGKTTLIEALLPAFLERGLRVATIKHSSHDHPVDTPGKDSFRHRAAGAAVCALVTPHEIGVFLPNPGGQRLRERLTPFFADLDLLLIEGHAAWQGPRLEVFRAGLGTAPLCAEGDDITAVVSDDPLDLPVPVWPRSDVPGLVEKILALPRPGGEP